MGSIPVAGAKKKGRSKTVFFLSNPKDWHVISRERVCNRRRRMASRETCIYLRIDAMHHFVMIPSKACALIPYRRQAADSIHAYGVIF